MQISHRQHATSYVVPLPPAAPLRPLFQPWYLFQIISILLMHFPYLSLSISSSMLWADEAKILNSLGYSFIPECIIVGCKEASRTVAE